MLASRISSKAAFTRPRTGQAHSRPNAAAPRHPTRPLSTVPAPPRPGTATVPWRPCTAPHSRASTLPIAHNRHSENTVRRHTSALANDACADTSKHAAMGSVARQHVGHAGHQPRAAHTQKPRPPACCSPIWLPRRSRLARPRFDIIVYNTPPLWRETEQGRKPRSYLV